jgi:Flp pilus assembly protein CpaB
VGSNRLQAPSRIPHPGSIVVILIVLIAAALLTSLSAVAYVPQPAAGAKRRRRFKGRSAVQVCALIIALGSVLLAVHIQWGGFP